MKTDRQIRVMELFAGVGGFRVGFDAANRSLARQDVPGFDVVWSNQWEPGESKQWASRVYVARFGDSGHSNEDLTKVPTADIPDVDLLVGGFPCQDYSVARTLNQASGIVGKKGVLWWEIHRIVREKAPPYLLLENVDRLLKSPASHRGRDFAIMLSALNQLGYIVEWKVVNAAEYGFPQRRRRVFILAYRDQTVLAKGVRTAGAWEWMTTSGVLASALPSSFDDPIPALPTLEIALDPALVSERFSKQPMKVSPFRNVGIAIDGHVYTAKGTPKYRGKRRTLGDVIEKGARIPPEFFVASEDRPKWEHAKGAKSLERFHKNGVAYTYDEGAMVFPDPLDNASRTIVTGEGGRTPSRFKHVIKAGRKLRRLLPVELERLNGFPDDHTLIEGVSDGRRAFFMGNALVTGIVTRIAKSLVSHGASRTADEPLGNHVKGARARKSLDGTSSDSALPKPKNRRVAKT